MAQKIFVNLPVKNLQRSMDFFGALGYSFNPQFTDENAACMVVSDNIFVMLLVEPYFQTFIRQPVSDAHRSTEVLIALDVENREAVDEMLAKVLAGGGTEVREAKDHGFMYIRAFQDLDGHTWEIFWMDMAAAPAAG